ncbi:MAG: dihydroorotase [Gammaproteobacteria bacterium]|nr:MAG: dihydroorotase [Gammaproteobacteria bacterium]
MQISIIQPDDFHLHLRDSALLKLTVPSVAKTFARAIVMPNLDPILDNIKSIHNYYNRIQQNIPHNNSFEPLMSLYLTNKITTEQMTAIIRSKKVFAIKLYPSGVTTNSQDGIKNIKNLYQLFEIMQKYDMPLMIHGESSDEKVDIFDREAVFIDKELTDIVDKFPDLRIVLEHISTKEAVDFIKASSDNIAATITPQHLMYNRNKILSGGIKPHYYCLPILKKESHRLSLIQAATSGSNKFFAGTDSAPHLQNNKENSCGCAGCFTSPFALELYAQIFNDNNKIDRLENFISIVGAKFYQLPINKNKIIISKTCQTIATNYATDDGDIIPFMAGQKIKFTCHLEKSITTSI